MSDLHELLAGLRRDGDLEPFLDAIPYMRTLGLRASVREGDLVTHLPGGERLIGNPVLPAIHGGVVGAMLESTATWARASITRLGRRIANVQVQAWQESEDRPIAVAHCHFLLVSEPA